MILRITDISNFESLLSTDSSIQVLIIHRPNSGFLTMINAVINRMEDLCRAQSVLFYHTEMPHRFEHPFFEMYRMKELPCILFFKDGVLEDKIESAISKIEFETKLKSLFVE